ncbi:MAG: hypothetical protein V3V74_07290 [Nitrosomonadaceae bacterium]
MNRINVKVITEDGNHWSSLINATMKEATKYYMENTFENNERVVRVYDLSKTAVFSYLGQCDTLRKKGPEFERSWKKMIEKKEVFKGILTSCDFSGMLDDDETIEQWFENELRQDSSAKLYKSVWGFTDCYFIQTCGFEFIFI